MTASQNKSIQKRSILFLNNYDMAKSRELYLAGLSPSHHQFGTSELINIGEFTVDYSLAQPRNYKNKIFKLVSLIPIWFKIYTKAKKYDIVYGGADFTVDYLGFMKKLGLFKPKLIGIFHHPPFEHRLSMEKYDRIIFLSNFSYEEISKKFPKLKNKLEFLQWGPDLAFYSKISPIPNFNIDNELIFISNGKTKRDHEIFVYSAEQTECKSIIVSDEKNIPTNFSSDCKYTEIYYQNQPNDVNMVKLLSKCAVLVIPTPPTPQRLGPIGLTSFLDAVAMGIPMISADNTVLTDLISQNNMGFIYQAGNLEDLKNKMLAFKYNKELIHQCGKNAYEFGRKNDIKNFSRHLYELLK